MSKKKDEGGFWVPKAFKPIVTQLPDGRWKCRTRDMPKSWNEGDTPDQAIERCKVAWEKFRDFCADWDRRFREEQAAEPV